jgi:hypothetical protein
MTGNRLCEGCATRLDAATAAQLAMGGLTSACATAVWLQRPLQHVLAHRHHGASKP